MTFPLAWGFLGGAGLHPERRFPTAAGRECPAQSSPPPIPRYNKASHVPHDSKPAMTVRSLCRREPPVRFHLAPVSPSSRMATWSSCVANPPLPRTGGQPPPHPSVSRGSLSGSPVFHQAPRCRPKQPIAIPCTIDGHLPARYQRPSTPGQPRGAPTQCGQPSGDAHPRGWRPAPLYTTAPRGRIIGAVFRTAPLTVTHAPSHHSESDSELAI